MAEAAPPVPQPVAPPAGTADPARLARTAALAALAIVGRVAFLWAPNVALTYLVVFIAGVLEGVWVGALVGLVAMTVTNLALSGLHPVLLANGSAMALLGIAGGLMRPWLLTAPRDRLDTALRATALAAVGLFGTLLFSLASDLVGFAVQFLLTPEGATVGIAALGPMLLAGLVFNLFPAVLNAVLFAAVTPALVRTLSRSGHLRRRVAARASVDA